MDSRRIERDNLLVNCICPVCEEPFTEFSDLYVHLLDHVDDGIVIAGDYLEDCLCLRAEEALLNEEEEG